MKSHHKYNHKLMLAWGVVGLIVIILAVFYLLWDVTYAGKVFPGVYLGELNLSKQTVVEAEQQINVLVKKLPKQTIVFRSEEQDITYSLKDLGVVYSAPILTEQTVGFGRQPNQPFLNLWQRLKAATVGVRIPAKYQEQLDLIDRTISKIRQQVDQTGVDGEVVISDQSAKIKPAVTGEILNGTILHQILQQHWRDLSWQPINLPIQIAPPLFNDQITQATADKINSALAIKYELIARNQKKEILPKELWQWMEIKKQNSMLVVKLRDTDLEKYIQELKKEIDQPVQEAVWEMKDNKVTQFQPDQPGVTLRMPETINLIQSSLLTDQHKVNLPADYVEPKRNLASLNNLGVTSLVARGESNFSGSPTNRRHNIKTGASKFNKALVVPGEEFSFNKILGRVDDTTGYRPELVIKGDKTTPEFGGGLCQVSTTTFRAALNGGYPITARHNHSYRVSYYEPAGTDATIYPPYPDFRFINDTDYYLLISTWIEGDNLYFDFYSTPTGRTVELEGPKIFNITEPPAPIYIETSELPEGVEKKIDTAHRGAETILYRHIYDSTGKEIKKDTFKSFYIPWPAKYLIGAKIAPKVETNLGNVPSDNTASEKPLITLSVTS